MEVYSDFYNPVKPVRDLPASLVDSLASLSLGQDLMKPESENALPDKEYILNSLDECPVCNSMYKRKGDLKNHMTAQHDISPSRIYFKCSCGTICNDQKQFSRHVKHNNH